MIITDEQLMFNEPILLDGVGNLIQPKIAEISKMGNENYFNLLLPFLITNDNIGEQFKGIDVYDFFFLDGNTLLVQQIAVCLNILFKQDIGYEVKNGRFVFKVGEVGVVCKENFGTLQDVVRKINCVKLPSPKKLPKNMTPEKLRIHEKMKFHRNRRAKLDEPTFKEIVNTVMHKGKSFIPYDVVANFTYYQLINSYQVIVGLSNYDEYLGYKLSSKYELKEDMPHWQKIIKMI